MSEKMKVAFTESLLSRAMRDAFLYMYLVLTTLQ